MKFSLLLIAAGQMLAVPGVARAEGPVTLAQAEATALRNQPTLQEAQGQLEAAQGRVEQARAGYLPQVTGTGTYERTTANYAPRPGTVPTGVTNKGLPVTWDPRFNFFQYGATATQLIYDFGQTSHRWQSAGANRDAAVDAQRTAELQALLTVRRAFFQARATRDLVAVADETVRNQETHVEQTRAFVRTGIQPDINLATVLTALANAKVQLVTARNNYDVACAVLAQAMGVPVTEGWVVADDELPPVPGEDGPTAPLTAQALRVRPEVANLENQQRAQAALVTALRGAYGPSFGGVASVTETGSSINQTVPNWYFGLTLSWAILQGGLTRGQVREANGTLTNVTGQLAAERLQVEVDVEQARLGVKAAKANIVASEEALGNARDQLSLAEQRYTHGLGSAVELGDAQVARTSAAAQLVQSQFNLASARAQLLAALGQR